MASIIYVTRDIERALGKLPENDYYIITNKTPYAIETQEQYPHNVFLIDSKDFKRIRCCQHLAALQCTRLLKYRLTYLYRFDCSILQRKKALKTLVSLKSAQLHGLNKILQLNPLNLTFL